MINTAVLVLKFLINLRFKQLGDIPNCVINKCIDARCTVTQFTVNWSGPVMKLHCSLGKLINVLMRFVPLLSLLLTGLDQL